MAIISASSNGHVKILKWFKNSGFEFKYDKTQIPFTYSENVLCWFDNNGYGYDKKIKHNLNIFNKN